MTTRKAPRGHLVLLGGLMDAVPSSTTFESSKQCIDCTLMQPSNKPNDRSYHTCHEVDWKYQSPGNHKTVANIPPPRKLVCGQEHHKGNPFREARFDVTMQGIQYSTSPFQGLGRKRREQKGYPWLVQHSPRKRASPKPLP